MSLGSFEETNKKEIKIVLRIQIIPIERNNKQHSNFFGNKR